ncbi:hypothetical protein D3C87_936180 [compost metagenome]|jgi:hypothetical protein|uniref:hypothetical protein n=1 Tax=Achromobacter sp. Root83 TaxID=1736602 RepID=UPI00070D8322|nr:hypothetical protein [Achromobacter sp. Root83]KRC85684.1 hypothetical protein ASE30_01550 [Achromobacter sp. Root83]
MAATPHRPFAALLIIAACASAPAHAEDCVAQVDASLARIKRAQDVQRTREAANELQLNRELCQGRLDLLDARFALSDDFEACRRKGVQFSDQVVRTLTDASEDLTGMKASWIRTCGLHMKD